MKIKEYKEFLTPMLLEEQEHLSKEILDSLTEELVLSIEEPRPTANFIDLMKWTENNFKQSLKDQTYINRYVHNRIIIDGQFLKFCRENSVSVTCLYKDSIISWKTDHDFEKFFVQGVFLIKTKNVEFIHAALFHKGNQNEDEVSFFAVVSNNNYAEYVKIRNSFDEWIQKRDRSNLHIRVVDGDDIPYTKDHTWSDLFLPSEIKIELQQLVENFLASKEFYNSNKIPWKRGVLLYGHPGNGKTSIIKTVMSMYNFKPVTVVPGAPDEAIREAFSYAEDQSPSLLYFEDLDSMLEKVDVSSFLNLMDGISAKNGLLVIATANDVRKLKSNITDRPSRFDRKFEIPQPNQDMAHIYLKRWFGSMITAKKCRELAKIAAKSGFSYVHLKDLYISSMFAALSQNRNVPTERDIDSALTRLIKEKTSLNGSRLVDTDKYFK
jgi:AAA+ superfamily predicted ATPase